MQEVGLPSHATRLMGAQKPQLWNRQRLGPYCSDGRISAGVCASTDAGADHAA
jgi:hypothetical protein